MNFSQEICDYSKNGREKIHENLQNVAPHILNYLVDNPVKGNQLNTMIIVFLGILVRMDVAI
jgi:hypothetical protein